ncbi:pyruvate kinase [Sporolactobacillus sp. THM7-7]|nr:pyruvate kinase [Sporolactobacillus sp. THM7-7]
MRRTKIVCTLGPSSDTVERLVQLINAGMNVARFNFSHGDHEEHHQKVVNLKEAMKKTGKTIGILLDTKGPEIRTHDMATPEVLLEEGKNVDISTTEVAGTAEKFSITYSELINDVSVGSTILIDDGLVELEVTGIDKEKGLIHNKIKNTGVLKSKKGIIVPNVSINLPGMTEKDADDIVFGIGEGIDYIAASFVRHASDVLAIRKLCEEHGAHDIHIFPKIESQEAVDNIEEILHVSDGIMVARGDLGVEIPPEDVPLVQKRLIKMCNKAGKTVITATQMLDSMIRNPRCTRAEASDVANAIFDGTDAIMLSGETASGKWPVEAVTTMNNIATKTETALDYPAILNRLSKSSDTTITDAIGQAVAHTALSLDVGAIITSTVSGHTARVVSHYRPKAPIIAVTNSERVAHKMCIAWGVTPVLSEMAKTTDEMFDIAVDSALKSGLVKKGELVVITAGLPVAEAGTTNLLQVQVVGDVLAQGQGVGRRAVTAPVYIADDADDANRNMPDGAILVVKGTDKDYIPAMRRSSGIVTEEGGLTSHAAVVGVEFELPVVIGVDKASSLFKTGEVITMDGERGKIYLGHANVL